MSMRAAQERTDRIGLHRSADSRERLMRAVPTGRNVYDEAIDRQRRLLQTYEACVVCFSGGKDSTCILETAIIAAELEGLLPVDVVFLDDEAMPPQVVEYAERTRLRPEVKMRWYAFPIEANNAANRHAPAWYPWAPEDEALWIRPKPEWALGAPSTIPTEPGARVHFPSAINACVIEPYGQRRIVAAISGLRSDENPQRRKVNERPGPEAWIAQSPSTPNVHQAKPIHDWSTPDVWTAIAKGGWDYCTLYDVLTRAGVGPRNQRVGSILAGESIPFVWWHRVAADVEFWNRCEARIPGARTAMLYGNTEAFGGGAGLARGKPAGMTFSEFVAHFLDGLESPVARRREAQHIAWCIKMHTKTTSDPILPGARHPKTFIRWADLVRFAVKTDPVNRWFAYLGRMSARLRRGDTELEAKLQRAYDKELAEWQGKLHELV